MFFRVPRRQILLLLTLLLAAPHRAVAQQAAPEAPEQNICPPQSQRPCVALVLGGGGARGSAHIGVIRAIEEYQIPVDLVVGTSIGAFVGGLYATGKTSHEIDQLFQSTDWGSGYRDNLNRSEIPNRRKRQLDDFPIHLDLGVGLDGIHLPKGFLRGQGMKALVDNMLGSYPNFESFDDLPIAFRAVAADAETGKEVVLADGDLATALQISMSLPGIVRPIEKDGRMLVDGGVANNLPVSVAKNLGADIVIAVDIGSPSYTREQLQSGFTILRQLTSFLTHINVAHQQSLLSENDVLLKPDIQGVSLLSFDKTLEAVTAGYTEAKHKFAQSPSLQQLEPATPAQAADAPALLNQKMVIHHIQLNNQSRLGDDYILHRLNLHEGNAYSPEEIHTAIDRLYGQGTIARINTSVRTSNNRNTLIVTVQEKEWGPGYMNFKFSFEDNFESLSHYQLGASYLLTNLSPYGAEWYTTMEIGTEKKFSSELYWPLYNSGFYLSYLVSAHREIYDPGEDSFFSGQLIGSEFGNQGAVGWTTTDIFDARVGLLQNHGTIKVSNALANLLGFDELDYKQRGGVAEFSLDTLDDASFPRSGWKWNSRVTHTLDTINDQENHATSVDSRLNAVASLGRHSLRGQLRYQSTDYDEPDGLIGNWTLGGFLNLSGNPKDSIIGQHVRFTSLVYTYELAANDFGAITLPLYLGVSAEAGNAWLDEKNVDYDDLIHSISAFVGWDSPLGPAYFAYGRSDTGNKSLYLFLGVVF